MEKSKAVPTFTPNVNGVGYNDPDQGTGPNLIIRLRVHNRSLPHHAYRIWSRAQPLPEGWDVVDPKFAWHGPNRPSSPYMSYREAVDFRAKLILRLTQERSRKNKQLLKEGASYEQLLPV